MDFIPEKIRNTGKAFFEEVRNSSETLFFSLLAIHMCVFFSEKINWAANETTMKVFSTLLQFITMVCAGAFLIYIIIKWKYPWKSKVWLLVPAVIVSVIPIAFNLRVDHTWYVAWTEIYFCLMAYGKDYKKIIWCYLSVAAVSLFIAAAGLPIGLTAERSKISDEGMLSFGIVYPNTWGQIAFLVLLAIWYLFLQNKLLITLVVFWLVGIFMYLVPQCKTITIFAVIFPVMAWLAHIWAKKPEKERKGLKLLMTALPFICFGLTMFLCWQMDWVKKYTYGTALESFGMRFVQGGIAFQHYGFPLIGHTLPNDPSVTAVVNGVEEVLYVVDNSYVTYGLFRGAIWMIAILSWLAYANWRSMKKRDYALTMIGVYMLIFALMERPGLDAWYNFIFLYPLASVAYLSEPEEKFDLRAIFAGKTKTVPQKGAHGQNRKHRR